MTDSYPTIESSDAANYERTADGSAMDETDVNLRAYFSRLSADKLRQYDPAWNDDELVAWDGNFTNEGCLFLVCSERDIEPPEYRRVLEEHLKLRGLAGS